MRNDYRNIGSIPVNDKNVTLGGALHSFVRVVNVELQGKSLLIRQFPYVCIFCGMPAANTLNGLGVCEGCLEEIRNLPKKPQKKRRG